VSLPWLGRMLRLVCNTSAFISFPHSPLGCISPHEVEARCGPGPLPVENCPQAQNLPIPWRRGWWSASTIVHVQWTMWTLNRADPSSGLRQHSTLAQTCIGARQDREHQRRRGNSLPTSATADSLSMSRHVGSSLYFNQGDRNVGGCESASARRRTELAVLF
jgi:hypothetical protein